MHQKTSRNGKFSNVAAYRFNMHKSIAFLYTNNKHTQEIMDKLPFTILGRNQ